MHKRPSEEVQRLLKTIYDDCVAEDISVRERQIRQWRRLKLLWEGFQHIYYSEVAHDWRVWDFEQDENSNQDAYDKPVNVFKAYLESIIAALSITVPSIKCYPDDADNTLDLATAKAGDKISQLIYRHNDVSLLWLHALFVFSTEGMTACYSYADEDKKYGTYQEKSYDDVEETHQISKCPLCNHTIDDNVVPPGTPIPPQVPNQIPNQIPGTSPAPIPGQIPGQIPGEIPNQIPENSTDEFDPQGDVCPACGQLMVPQVNQETFVVSRLVGITDLPKSRMCMEVYGGLYVKIPNYVKCQSEAPYLIFSKECDYSMIVEEYQHLHGKFGKEFRKKLNSGNQVEGAYSQYEQWGRLSPQYQGEYPINVVTVNHAWIRPAKFNILPNEADVSQLKKLYPNGVKVTFVNDEFASACNEDLDDHWTLSYQPLSDFLHFDPPGQGLVSIQEITNDLISLILQTIEHGISQTFADPAVLGFKAYGETEVTPGGIFPATPKSGKSLSDGFHDLKTATLSQEVMPFQQSIQSMAQLTSGALPSLFGGQMSGGGETASQYSMSRAQAQQRLQNTWKMFTVWWKTIFGKVVPMYIKTVKEDERDVQKDIDGNFVNILIKKAELEGKIGKVELEGSETLPQTWSQIKDTIEKLMINPNEVIQKMLSAPENLSLVHDALGLVDFYIPGEDDIIKQYDEIKLLLNSSPLPNPEFNPADPTSMPETPSVEVDVTFDNHIVEFEICRKWIVSEAGRQTKTDNEEGYRNVLLHGKLHFMQLQQMQQAQQASMPVSGAAPPKKPNPLETKQAPIQGEGDVKQVH